MYNCYNSQQLYLMNQLRQLWTQHVYWTRLFIVSTVFGLPDLEPVTNRLLQNPADFAKLLMPIYGAETANRFKTLLTEHLSIASDLLNAAKNKETDKADAARVKWYKNADEIAAFLPTVNPYWNEARWRSMLYNHLEMTEREATLQLQGNYPASIKLFESVENEALKMADYMAEGIIKQFFF